MIKKLSIGSPIFRNSVYCSILLFVLTLTFSQLVKAQPEFSREALQLLRERKIHPGLAASRFSTEPSSLPLPADTKSRSLLADGDLDPGFNASVSEGTGYVFDSVVQPNGKIVIAGTFDRINGTRIINVARLNADGTLDTSFNPGTSTNGAIRTIALQSDGKILIGGAFTNFNGQTVRRIVRLNSDGSRDLSFSTEVALNTGQVNDIALLADGKILVGGSFTFSSTGVVCLNGDGTLFQAISGFSLTNKIIVLSDGKILVGGSYMFGSSSANAVRRLNADFSFDSTFNPGTSANRIVFDMVVQPDGKIILSGEFTSFNGTPTDNIVRINSNGSLDASFDFLDITSADVSGVYAVALQSSGKILASVIVQTSAGLAVRILRFNTDATPDSTFTVGDLDQTYSSNITALGDDKFLVGGGFVSYNGQTRLHLAKLNQDGTLDNSFIAAVSANGIVYAIKRQADGKTLIAGDFEFVNGVRKTAMARLNADGTLDNSFALPSTGFYGDIYDFDIQPDGKIVIGGMFYGSDSFPAFYHGRINSDGSFDNGLSSNTINDLFVFPVYDVTLQPDNKILVGGSTFSNINSNRYVAARFNADGTVDAGFTPAIIPTSPTTVRAMAVQPNGKIIVGGNFMFSSGFQRTGLLRLNSDGTLDSVPFGGNANVTIIKQTADGSIYAGGNQLTKHSADGVLDTTLNTGSGVNNFIRALDVQPDGKIIFGGFFTTYNGTPVNKIARIHPNGALDAAFSTANGTSGTVYAISLQPDNKILVGGSFSDFNGAEKFSIARLLNTGKYTPFDFDGDGKTDIGIYRPADSSWWYSRSSDNAFRVFPFGASGDVMTPGDFTGDGKADIAIFRPSSGEWFIQRSENNTFFSFPFGASGDVPVPADFDGDGKADAAVYRPSTGTWFILNSNGTGTAIVNFGSSEDKPVPADFDGDGKADIAIFRPSDGSWWYLRSSDLQFRVFRFGLGTDKPVPGDYTGDGKADIAVFRPSTGEWFFQRSEDNSYYSLPFGANGDIAAPGDYDGDGKFDTAVFRPSAANWFIQRSTAGILITSFGASGDRPIPNAFVP